jgi:hypothetical protein
VAVVGLPGEQVVFRFLGPGTGGPARRQALAVPYGRFAIKLSILSDERLHKVLDRWQYAAAQQELASLDARLPLWCFGAAAPGLANNANDAAATASVVAATAAGASAAAEAAAARAARSSSKTQRRRAAQLAKAAAAEQKRRRKAAGAGSRAPAALQAAEAAAGAGDAAEAGDALPPPTRLSDAAFTIAWETCTVRGLPDGAAIFCFGSDAYAALAPSAADSREGQRSLRRRALKADAQLPWKEGMPFSNALRLGTRFPDQVLGR